MCIAIPMRITAVDGTMATTETDGLVQKASLALVPEAVVGDFILIHAGYALTVIDEAEAQERLELFAEWDEFERGQQGG